MDILNPLLSNPISLGIILNMAKSFIQGLFKKVDDQGLAEKNKGWLEPLLIVLTVITSGISQAMQGHLAQVDMTTLMNWLQAALIQYFAAKGTGTETVTKVANKVAGK